MSTDNYDLAELPTDTRRRELWLQHAAGFILLKMCADTRSAKLIRAPVQRFAEPQKKPLMTACTG